VKGINFVWFVLLFLSFTVQAVNIKHNTVSDYLLKAKQQAETEGRKPNQLINESSPYLLQHAYNPVNWYPWGDEAFDRARKENKPIFLSIGYSTCHWCHVMARESFENKKIAALLNKNFISIKVDREQRPDIDKVYMSATQLISGHGGWPMSVFIDHQLRPFHAATYYPPFSTENHLGLEDILLRIHELWLNKPEEIKRVAASVTGNISAAADESLQKGELHKNSSRRAFTQITQIYDDEYGGFGVAPKFPRPGIFSLLIDIAKQPNDVDSKKAQQMIGLTLDKMAAGGIYDQLAGGFHRYSVDNNWQVPHFEKMLYNQALMVMAYSDFYLLQARPEYKTIVFETLEFVRQEMRSAYGGYYSALDADSERAETDGGHAEGVYYLWSESELKSTLSAAEFAFVKKYFQIELDGNILSDPQDEFTGLNILYVDEDYRETPLTKKQKSLLSSVKTKLNEKRRLRNRPHLDDKIITAWNGMMVVALAKAATVFDHPAFLQESIVTLNFIKDHLYDKDDNRLYRLYRKDDQYKTRSRTSATLSDYAWLIYGLLEVYKAGFDKQWLELAVDLQDKQDVLFLDESSGVYFESIAGDSHLLFRSKTIYDGALPSANAIALSNLRAFSRLSDGVSDSSAIKRSYALQADKLLSSFAQVINQNPAAASMALSVELQNRSAMH